MRWMLVAGSLPELVTTRSLELVSTGRAFAMVTKQSQDLGEETFNSEPETRITSGASFERVLRLSSSDDISSDAIVDLWLVRLEFGG